MRPLFQSKVTRRAFLGVGVAALATGGVAGRREMYSLDLPEYDVPIAGLSSALDGFRIAQISDLHRGPLVSEDWLHECVDRCNDLRPDAVLLTGDFISIRASYIDSCAEALKRLQASHGCYAVLGNHDHWEGADRITQGLQAAGVEVLTNQNTRLGEGLHLVGVDETWVGHPDRHAAFLGVPNDAHPLVMTHNPWQADAWIDRPMTMLCGHTHGGQVNIFGMRAIHAMRGLGYLSGWFDVGPGKLYVNRGVGVVTVPLRLGAPPEITLFRLRSAAA